MYPAQNLKILRGLIAFEMTPSFFNSTESLKLF